MENKTQTSARRMYIQELALLSLVRRGETEKPVIKFGREDYKLKCADPKTPTPKPEERQRIPQIEIHTP